MSELALKLIEENKRTKNPFLDLGNCGLVNYIPEELVENDWLVQINLGKFYYVEEKGLQTSNNNWAANVFYFFKQATDILKILKKLRCIYVSDAQIKDISSLKGLKNIDTLDIRNNQIKDVSFLSGLTNLKTLYLHKNQIKDCTSLGELNNLNNLGISENQITDNNFLGKLAQLRHLNIHSNQIKDFSVLYNLKELQELYINNNSIQNINFLQNLRQLKKLDLSRNQIQNISSLQNLTKLQSLYLHHNQIQDISFLQNLRQLEKLELSHNQIENISFLQNLKLLKELYLSYNQIQYISSLKNLSELHTLYLRFNQIQDYSFLQSLTKLHSLDLRSSQIQDIEPLKFLFSTGLEANLEEIGGRGVLLYDNTIINPPIEIIKQGREAIIRYFDRIKQEGFNSIFEAKLTLVGNGGAGKTSFQRRLLNDKAELPAGNDSTRGIKVHDWLFDDRNGNRYTTHIWDFGGQDVYYPVHRFFLTENSVYILMASTRFAVHNFNYWIPTIYQFGGNSPIILVQNCDNGNQKDWADIKRFYAGPEYNLKPVYKINLHSADNWGLKNLKGFIQHQITELPHIGKTIPKSWVKLREQLIEKAKTIDCISFEKFTELCVLIDKDAFKDELDVEDLARFLHDLGIILWYQSDNSFGSNNVNTRNLLRHLVILNPEWAMNAVYKIIDDTIIQKQNGIIYREDFNRIWGEESYRTKIGALQLMLQVFKIAFPKQQQKDDYFLPARLQPIPDEQLWTSDENLLRLEYHFDFIPPGLVNQLSAELSNKILSDEHIWSNAVILKNDTSNALIIEDLHKDKILIKAKGNDARGLILLIMNSMQNIVKEYRGVMPALKVPCKCIKCQKLGKPTIFEYDELLDLQKENRTTVTCNKSNELLSIYELLYSIGLKDNKQDNNVPKIFFSYAWGDDKEKDGSRENIVNELYESLKSDNYDLVRDKNDLSYKGLISEFMRKIGKGEFVIVAISDKYLKSPYCMFELYEVYRRSMFEKEEFIKKIFPICVEQIDFNDKAVMSEYLNHWKNKKDNEEKFLKEFLAIAANSQFNEYKNINDITARFSELCGILKDMNLKTKELVSKDDFDEIKRAIKAKQGNQ